MGAGQMGAQAFWTQNVAFVRVAAAFFCDKNKAQRRKVTVVQGGAPGIAPVCCTWEFQTDVLGQFAWLFSDYSKGFQVTVQLVPVAFVVQMRGTKLSKGFNCADFGRVLLGAQGSGLSGIMFFIQDQATRANVAEEWGFLQKRHIPTEKWTSLQQDVGFRAAHCRKPQEIAGRFQASRIKNASVLSQGCWREGAGPVPPLYSGSFFHPKPPSLPILLPEPGSERKVLTKET